MRTAERTGLTERLAALDDVPAGEHPPEVTSTVEDGIGIVTISNPTARNALNLQMWASIEEAFRSLAGTDGLRLVIVRGIGRVAFAAGADISEFPETRFDSVQAARYNDQLSRALRAVAGIEVPTIAMIHGFAVGGGCELSAACDLRVGADDARIGIPVGRLGVILGLTESRLLVRHIGVHGLKRVLFSGELFTAEASRSLGLLDEVHPADELAGRVAQLATAITTSSATTMTAAKVITDLAGKVDDASVERIAQLMAAAYDGADLREGVSAFLGKRQPRFGGE